MSALPFLHDRQFSPRLSLVCLVCLLLLPACPAPGSGLDGTAHNHHAQIRAGDAYSNVYGVMAYGDSARARYGTVVNDGGQAVQAFGGWCYGGVADTAYNSVVVHQGLISNNVYGGFADGYQTARSTSNTVLQTGGDVSHVVGGHADSGRGKALADSNLVSSTAINRCRMEKKAVTYTGVSVDTLTGRRVIDLSVQPIIDSSGIDTGLLAILFVEHGETTLDGIVEKYDINITAAQRITDLEHELQVSQNDLRTTIGELETVNEELQAANEELLTANEELQSSNEELQSVNEELYTVNSEFQQKLDELTTMTNDLSNFLSSTMIGILFVDSHLNIRKFTEYIGREFQLESQDVGRSMQIFAHSFPDEDIVTDARNVLKDLTPVDREVVGMNGRFYTMRIAPYRTTENSIRGLVITVIDSLGSSNERTRESDHETSSPEGA